MFRKRSLLRDISDCKRRKLNNENVFSDGSMPSNTSKALEYVSKLFPSVKFQNKFPPIVLKHQIYAFVKSRTEADKELNELRRKGEIRLFKLGDKNDNIGVVYLKDYVEYVLRCSPGNRKVADFLRKVVAVSSEISFSNAALRYDYNFQDSDIVELIQHGVLTCRDVGCYWLSIPRVGEYMKTFYYGRRAILQHVRRTKYKEILQSELEHRKLPKKALLGILYHIYDIVGSDAVTCVETSTGTVLRLHPDQSR